MTKITTRSEFKEYCLRKLGYPVIDINVDDTQIEDRIDDALQFWGDYHYDGSEKIYMKHMFTQEDIDRRWIYCPDAVNFVTGVFPWDDSNSSVNMFDLRYQLRLHDLYDLTSVSYVSYEITMQHIRTLNLLFSGTPQFRFSRHLNKLYLDIDWERDAEIGRHVVIECYRTLAPDTATLTGTLSGNTLSNTITGIATKFDQEILEGDVIRLEGDQEIQVKFIKSPTEIIAIKNPTEDFTDTRFYKDGISDVWGDRFLKAYATAMIKKQWGENLSKYSNIQLPGGVTLDGPRIMQEAQLEIDKIEEEMQVYNILPGEIFMG